MGLICMAPYAWTSSGGLDQDKMTGAPNETNCTATCHSDNPINDPGGSVSLKFEEEITNKEVNYYESGKTYRVRISVYKPGFSAYGFEMCAKALKGTLWSYSGTFDVGTGSAVNFVQGTTKYVTHNLYPSNNGFWNVLWKAPASTTDEVTFFIAALAGNKDGKATGDYTYLGSKNFRPISKLGIEQLSSTVKIPANPVSNHLIVDFAVQNSVQYSIKVYTLQGKEIKLPVSLQGDEENKRFVVETASLPQGIYIFSLQGGNEQASKKFLKE